MTGSWFINIFKALYDNSSCCVKTASGYTEFFVIVSGVRQDSIFSSFLFIIVINFIMRRTMDNSEYGIVWQKWNCLTDLDFADDVVIVAEEENVCQEMTTKLEEQSTQVRLNISREKNEGHENHPAFITTANSRCTRKHRICREIHLPGKMLTRISTLDWQKQQQSSDDLTTCGDPARLASRLN